MMVALAFALSYVRFLKLPFDGSVTLCSMLPIMLIGIKYGPIIGLGTGFVYSITQVIQSLTEGTFSGLATWYAVLICLFFDYIIPFTCLGLSGIFGKRGLRPYAGMFTVVAIRLAAHVISGVTIWKSNMPADFFVQNVFVYSVVYNSSFLLPDFAICLAAAIVLLNVPQMRKLVGLPPRGTMAAEQPASDAQRDSDEK